MAGPLTEDQDVEKWIRELNIAGWMKTSSRTWEAPCGCQFLGPYRAWHCMTMGHVALHQQRDRLLASERSYRG